VVSNDHFFLLDVESSGKPYRPAPELREDEIMLHYPSWQKKFTVSVVEVELNSSWREGEGRCLCMLNFGTMVTTIEEHEGWAHVDRPVAGWIKLQSANGDKVLKPYEANAEAGGGSMDQEVGGREEEGPEDHSIGSDDIKADPTGVTKKRTIQRNSSIEVPHEKKEERRHKRAPSVTGLPDNSTEGESILAGNKKSERSESPMPEKKVASSWKSEGLHQMFRSRKRRWQKSVNNVFEPGLLKIEDEDGAQEPEQLFGRNGHRKLLDIMHEDHSGLDDDDKNLIYMNQILTPGQGIIDSMRKKTKVQSAARADRHIYLNDKRKRVIADTETEKLLLQQQKIILDRHYPLRSGWRIVGWVFLLVYIILCDILVIYYGLQWDLKYSFNIQSSTLAARHAAEDACPAFPDIAYDWKDSFELDIQNQTSVMKYSDRQAEIDDSSLRKTFGDSINDAEKFTMSFIFSLILSWFFFHPLFISFMVLRYDYWGGTFIWSKQVPGESPKDFVVRLMDTMGKKWGDQPHFTLHQFLHHPHFVRIAVRRWKAVWQDQRRRDEELQARLNALTPGNPDSKPETSVDSTWLSESEDDTYIPSAPPTPI